ncbi:MAG: DUF432 domain-containing protein [Cellvibrionaceae bacterium]
MSSDTLATESKTPWWHPVELSEGQCWRYAIGPLAIYLQRHASEWWLATDMTSKAEELYRLDSGEVPYIPEGLSYSRYLFKESPSDFCLKPRLLDRPVVVRTNQAVNIPPQQSVTFYISTPVCISISLANGRLELQETPVLRLSDTWFGPSTQIGELCYATKTQARNSRREVPLRPHRAVTPVLIHNNSEKLLTIDKLSLPVPYLPVYGLPDGTLWTSPIELEHQPGDALAKLKISDQPPEGAGKGDYLMPAREFARKGSLVRAFVDILSG